MTVDTRISNTIAAHSGDIGLYLSTASNTCISNMTITHNHGIAMYLYNMSNTYTTNTTILHNHGNGMVSYKMSNTFITNLHLALNGGYGMKLSAMSNTHITNSNLSWNGWFLFPWRRNGGDGMKLSAMSNTHITNVTLTWNALDGMSLSAMSNTHITNTTTKYNYFRGIILKGMRNTHMTNTIVTHNSQLGIHLSSSNNTHMTKTTVVLNGINFLEEIMHEGVGIFSRQIIVESSTNTLMYNSSFTGNDLVFESILSTENPTNLPSVIVLLHSPLLVSGCDSTRNSISAIAAYASNITVSGDLMFSNNKAFTGTAFILIHDSIITSTENSHIYFLNNHASNNGGVFYITGNKVHLVKNATIHYSRSTCFLNTEGSRSQTRFTFANNSADKGGDILYGGHVASGLDGDWNCLENFKNISNISQNGLSLISSDPS